MNEVGFWDTNLCVCVQIANLVGYGEITVANYQQAISDNNTALVEEYDNALMTIGQLHYAETRPTECPVR